jgi:hypothetical protein
MALGELPVKAKATMLITIFMVGCFSGATSVTTYGMVGRSLFCASKDPLNDTDRTSREPRATDPNDSYV